MPSSLGPLLKTAIFTLFVPGIAAGLVPWRLREAGSIGTSGLQRWAAIVMIILGTAIYVSTAFWGFAYKGSGTPAPIAPTRRLVVIGLHRFVRNPMYIGVSLVIAGQAWLFHSLHIAAYLALFLIVVHVFVLTYEEPTLKRQFGQEYEDYRRRVPRWIPHFRN